MTKKQPAFQFYTGDWLKDPDLGMCTAATRGIWIDMLSLMHERDRCGQLCGTVIQLARICRSTPEEIVAAINELCDTKTADVTKTGNFSQDCHGVVTVTNRRMREDYLLRENNKLRKRSSRQAQAGHTDVTPSRARLSSSSSSSSVGGGGFLTTSEGESNAPPPPPKIVQEQPKQEIPRPDDPVPVGYAMTRLTNFGMHFSHIGDEKDRARIAGWVRKGVSVQAFENALLRADQARRAAVSADERPEPLYARHVEPFLFDRGGVDEISDPDEIQAELEQWYTEEQAAGRLP